MIRQGRDRHGGLAVDAALAGNRSILRCGRLDPGAQGGEPERAVDVGGDRPRAVAFLKRDLIERGAAQPASRGQERDRFDQIGLAGAVGPDQHDGRGRELNLGRAVAAEIRQGQSANAGGAHGRPVARLGAWRNEEKAGANFGR